MGLRIFFGTAQRRESRFILFLRLFFVACVLVSTSCAGGKVNEEIVLGVVAMKTGPYTDEDSGEMQINAARLAADTVNAEGGLTVGDATYRVSLEIEDDRGTPEGALHAVRSLIDSYEVAVIIGPQFSATAIPAGKFADTSETVMICPISTHPETTRDRSFVFRVTYTDEQQGRVLGETAYRYLGARTAAILYDEAGVYNCTLSEFFSEAFESAGGKIVAAETYTSDRNAVFTEQLAVIGRAKPDVLFLPNYANDVEIQAKQARLLGIDAVLVGGDGWNVERFAGRPEFTGSITSRHWHAESNEPASVQFREAFVSRFNEEPDDVAATTYDACRLYFDAAVHAGSVSSKSVRSAMHDMPAYSGVTGRIEYDATGDPVKQVHVVEITREGVRLVPISSPDL